MLHEFTEAVLLIFTGLFPIINPPAAALILLSLVPNATVAERAQLAARITLNSLVILVVSLSSGAYVLNFFGISVAVLRLAGGIIVAMSGWTLLQTPEAEETEKAAAIPASARSNLLGARAFYPLTLPMTVGPARSRSRSRWVPTRRRQDSRQSCWRALPSRWSFWASASTCACDMQSTSSGCSAASAIASRCGFSRS
jgi:hypothetical protein